MFTKYSFLVIISIFPALSLILSKQQDSKLTKLEYLRKKKNWLKMCDLSLKGTQQSGKGVCVYDQQFLLFQQCIKGFLQLLFCLTKGNQNLYGK